ncbi:YciE/YciF ferroxidase family protein [Kaistella polysaccharea]|uniref:YciE/YciF ferroxidase family protein n=1 Tax=Kaistella polysaccharea TaxID=2878534 RepID=UPI001CF55C1C|nr:ferritin-like domain-containing protein [Kaistella polysaccharea]
METKKAQSPKKGEKKDIATSLRDFFVDGLKDIYWAENALVQTLPKMFDHSTDQKLKTAIKDHLAQTKEHVKRLEQVFESIGEKAEGKKCMAMDGIIKEGEGIIEETQEGPVRDAGIIASAQKVEHYEIATYGTLAAFAKTLNERTALDLLLRTLGEEKKSDTLLSYIADTNLNSQAVDGRLRSKDLNAV